MASSKSKQIFLSGVVFSLEKTLAMTVALKVVICAG